MTSPTQAEHAVAKFRQAGYKITPARRVVVEALALARDHLSAPGLVQVLHDNGHNVSRASVYRTLELLNDLGLVQLSSLGGATTTYLLTDAGHHHHVVCRKCHKAEPFDDCALKALENALSKRMGFCIEGHLVELYGLCPDCQRC